MRQNAHRKAGVEACAGERLARVTASAVYYYFEDHLETTKINVQAGQNSACYDADFDPYGGEHAVTSTCAYHYKFTGKERDSETGNDSFPHRYYASVRGRWMTPDPGGIAAAHPGDPQSWNMYAYVRNNPTTLNDPTGLEPEDAQRMAGNESDIAADWNPFWNSGAGSGEAPPEEYSYQEYMAVALSGVLPNAQNLTTLGFVGNAVVEMTVTRQAQPQANPHNAAIDAAYQLACSHSVQGCGTGQSVQVRYVGFTYNVQIPGDLMDPKSLPKEKIKDLSLANMIFHKGSGDSYYLTSPLGLFGPNVSHVVNLRDGVEAHVDHWGPGSPLHWAEAFLSLFINTRAEAGKGVTETCTPAGGCR